MFWPLVAAGFRVAGAPVVSVGCICVWLTPLTPEITPAMSAGTARFWLARRSLVPWTW